MPDEWKDLVRHIDYKDSPSSMKFTVDITLEDINKYLKKYHKEEGYLPEVVKKDMWEQYLKESKPDEDMLLMLQEQVVEDMIPWARKNSPKYVPDKRNISYGTQTDKFNQMVGPPSWRSPYQTTPKEGSQRVKY